MKKCFKSPIFWILTIGTGVGTFFLMDYLTKKSYEPRIGNKGDFKLGSNKFKSKIGGVDDDAAKNIKWYNYHLFHVPYLNDLELAYVFYDSGRSQDAAELTDAQRKSHKLRGKMFAYSKAELIKRGIYDEAWINDPYTPSNREYYERTGKVLGKPNMD